MKYYLTTPIYYVNGAPHIGHFYTTAVADMIRRFKRMEGYDPVVFTTGSDEHGQNVDRAAKAVGKTPEQFADDVADEWMDQWRKMQIVPDRFIRTSDPKHFETVRDVFERCKANGYIYKGTYVGQYCFHDELYVNDANPGDPCPDCGRITETVKEDNYFFKLSAFQDRLLQLYDDPNFIAPDYRRNEVITFVKQGLKDLSITRSNLKWGIPVPEEGNHVFYVWFDALISYMSAVKGENLWPADLHLIGKDILRFHTIYWPAFLMAAGLPLPKRVFAHGFIMVQENKMSKSRGNIVRPWPICQVMGTDTLRYFLFREITFGQDGSFSYDAIVQRYNSDFANGLGNLASRTLNMIQQYRGGMVPVSDGDGDIAAAAEQIVDKALQAIAELNLSRYLETVWGFVSTIDKFIVDRAPWKLAKDPDMTEALDRTLYSAAEALRIICGLLHPAIPQSTSLIWTQLGMPDPIEQVRLPDLHWGRLQSGQRIGTITPVFPRIEAKPAIERMQAGEVEEKQRQDILMGKVPAPEPVVATAPAPSGDGGTINIDDFMKVDLRVGLVKSAERVKGADKLLHLYVDIGEAQPRSIVAGIASSYEPASLVGRKVVIVANLAPRKLRGLESQGMIVAASSEGGNPVLASFVEDIPPGARLK
ncbi:MAG: methionine--tRNA ligase [Acidobacteriaceae bacterium]|nr:methionine--tRNA ligase [Acidobacteriaceae bacterium]